MNFFRDVVSHLLKNAFEGHTQFSVADNTAVGDNPIRSISLDAVPVNESTMISLAWEGGQKVFEKTLSEEEAKHQFELIATDLAEVASLTKEGQYDAAKDLMKKLGMKYAENTGELVQTNLPPLHNTQASQNVEARSRKCPDCGSELVADEAHSGPWGTMWACPEHGMVSSINIVYASAEDEKIWREAKITMQNLWFSTTDELLDYQQKQKGAAKPGDQDHIPLWDKTKGATQPADKLAPASLSYEDLEDKKEQEHEDMQKHIDETIKTELESALQQKAASVFGPDQVELVQILKKNGRNWDEIKKILIKDFNFDKDSVNIFVDEQRQGSDPAGIEVEPVKEDKKEDAPLTPPEELVSPETHDKLLQDHEDKKKDNSPVEAPVEQNFTPKEIMDIPEDEIQDESALSNEIARADNDEIHKVAAAPSDLNPLQEPIEQDPTLPTQDAVPMGKKPLDHEAPQKGDRVFVASDMTDEKAGFEGTFVSTYKSQGRDQYIVETDQGDLLDVDAHRVSKISDNGGAQVAEPSMEPIIETPKEEPIQVTPKMSDFHTSSQDEALSIKAELDEMLKIVKEAGSYVIMPMMYGIDDDSILQYANGSIYGDKIKSGQMQDADWQALLKDTARWMTQVGRQKVSQTFSQDAEWKLDDEQINKLKSMFNVLPKDNTDQPAAETESSLKTADDWATVGGRIEDFALIAKSKGIAAAAKEIQRQYGEEAPAVLKGLKVYLAKGADAYYGMEASLKQAAPPADPTKTQFKDYKITPKYTPKQEAVPATPEIDAVLSKMASLEQNLATLETARQQIQAKMQEEMNKVDQSGERVQMEAELQESIEKAAVLINAVESKVVQWKDKLYTLQTEEVQYVPKLSQKELLGKIYEKFAGAEKYVKDVLNGMLSQAKSVTENTLIRWPNKKSSVNKEATILDDMNRYNEELMAALQALSSPI